MEQTILKPENFFSDYNGAQEYCCIFGDHNGIYNIPNVIKLAMQYGFTDKDLNIDMDDQEILDYEFNCEVMDDAERYLNKYMPEGYYFGNFEESGDVGIVKIEEETEID